MKTINLTKRELPVIILYFTLYVIICLSLLIRQPFGDPPDELNRYLVPQYIAEHGTLPNGYDESIRIPSYGFSYAFQPILPYMAQGWCMRFVKLFTDNATVLFYTARLVDFIFGLIMAIFVLLLGKKWFQNKYLQYVFCFFVMFLPQSIFLHSYINTDSCCMMSIAIILYGLTCGLENHFTWRSCTILSIGIILCALSYYNAYGYILSSILLFTAQFLYLRPQIANRKPYSLHTSADFAKQRPANFAGSNPVGQMPVSHIGSLHIDWGNFLKKGGFVCVLVLLGISWWFIRSYLLYDGDFLGLRTRDLCGALYGNENMKPGMRVTYQSSGYTVLSMLAESDFLLLSINSLISMYGPMTLHTALWIYRFYKLWFGAGLLCCLLPIRALAGWSVNHGKAGNLSAEDNPSQKIQADALCPECASGITFVGRPALTVFFHANMALCMALPVVLSIIYSYRSDYQPQGRYLMPMLIPLCYYCVRGAEKGLYAFCLLWGKCTKKTVNKSFHSLLLTGLCVMLILIIIIAVLVTVYGYAYTGWATGNY